MKANKALAYWDARVSWWASFTATFVSCNLFHILNYIQKDTKCFMNSLNNEMHRKDHFTSCNPIKTGKNKVNFHCTWPNANYFCVFHSNEYVNNISANMLKTNFLTSYMQMTKKNPGHLEFFICLPRWLCRMLLLLNMSHVTCKSYVIANQAL